MVSVAASNLQPPQYERLQNTVESQQPTIFCDFDGPIVDVSNRYYATYQLGLDETQAFYQARGIALHIQPMSKQQFWQMKQNRIPDVEIATRSGLQGEQIDFFLGRVVEIVNQPHLLKQDRIQPGVSWALALLHFQGFRLVLVTLRCQLQAAQILRNNGLTRLFSGIYGTSDRNAAYQNQAQLKQQLLSKAISEQSQLAKRPLSAWMIGDTEADLLAGQALSIPTIALTCGIRSHYYLQQFQPTRIHSDLLAAAHYLRDQAKAL